MAHARGRCDRAVLAGARGSPRSRSLCVGGAQGDALASVSSPTSAVSNDRVFNHLAYAASSRRRRSSASRAASSSRSRTADYIPNLTRRARRTAPASDRRRLPDDGRDGRRRDEVPEDEVRDHRRHDVTDAQAQAEERRGPALHGAARPATSSAYAAGLMAKRRAQRRSALSAASRSRRSTATSPATSTARRRPTRASRR